ncbi:homoserine O-acetyltransferase [Haoranjiania flava]|uniref:Homoserine O-acetyltransferase n=1 Tax=Haoranjiania flava TaxID=1856322 RepID=A0AAE3LLZ1_9BACT|nr:homoserine O-acetyltransferase [Haoranjiania flava]MCU7693236.1 homoserine O-acetyltransferase [Haoranjiania flava]
MKPSVYKYKKDFLLECGKTIAGFHLQYATYGKMNADKSNVVWVFHALTANSDAKDWWPGLIGEEKLFNPQEHFIICANIPGSCYGSSGPLDINPKTKKPYYKDFPIFTIKDIVRSFIELKAHLGIDKIWLGIGGSLGGMQLLEWAVENPDDFEHIIPIATSAKASPWVIAMNTSQRMCIEQDPTWNNGKDDAGKNGMKTARTIALLSYRNYETYTQCQQGVTLDTEDLSIDQQVFRAETYQRYQGEKLAKRFNAYSYYNITKILDTHDVGRGRGTVEFALSIIKAKTLVIGISSDLLFPVKEQALIAEHVKDAHLEIIESFYGHDGFLLEFEVIHYIISKFLKSK